ncbi:hypothetical protein GCM10027288_17960 [Bordetella tumbae]
MKRLLWMMLLSLLILSAGCASPPVRVVADYCEHANLYWFDDSEQIKATPAPVRRFLRDNNETWLSLCKADK